MEASPKGLLVRFIVKKMRIFSVFFFFFFGDDFEFQGINNFKSNLILPPKQILEVHVLG